MAEATVSSPPVEREITLVLTETEAYVIKEVIGMMYGSSDIPSDIHYALDELDLNTDAVVITGYSKVNVDRA